MTLAALAVLTDTSVVIKRAEYPVAASLHVIGGADAAKDWRFPHLLPGLETALSAGYTKAKHQSNDTSW